MIIKELIEELQKYPENSFVEIAVEGKLWPAGKVLHWPKDRNGFNSVAILPPLTMNECEEAYEKHEKTIKQ